MTLALPSPIPEQVRACFVRMQQVQAGLRDQAIAGQSYDKLSMGMSGDFELAIQHGATVVRVGTAIFGQRGYPALG
jgi:PLP dependent protein